MMAWRPAGEEIPAASQTAQEDMANGGWQAVAAISGLKNACFSVFFSFFPCLRLYITYSLAFFKW